MLACYNVLSYGCLSVCFSVISQYSAKMAKLHTAQGLYMFLCQRQLGEIPMESPSTRAPNAGGVG